MRLVPALAATLALLLVAPAVPAPSSAATLSFKLVDSGSTGPELNLGVTSKGAIFVGGWDTIARSHDDGATWTPLQMTHLPFVGFAADRVLVVDHDTDRVFVSDTYLGCTLLAWTDDEGATWGHHYAACGGGATDHQKVAVGKRSTLADPTGGDLYENLVYVCANGLSHTNCGVSADGGLTFLPTAPHGVGCAFHGAPVADANGVLYVPTTQCGAQVRRTANNGASWATLPVPGASASRDAPDVAITPDGTVYFFYTTSDWKPRVARSANGGLTWSFIDVPVPGLTSALFPSVVAGDDGRIGLAFYGTTTPGVANPGAAPAGAAWHGYVAVVTHADTASPVVEVAQVTPPGDPLQYGCLSKLGSCLGNIADYIDVDVGPDGRVYAVFVDGCPPGCASASASKADHALVAVQTGGPRLAA